MQTCTEAEQGAESPFITLRCTAAAPDEEVCAVTGTKLMWGGTAKARKASPELSSVYVEEFCCPLMCSPAGEEPPGPQRSAENAKKVINDRKRENSLFLFSVPMSFNDGSLTWMWSIFLYLSSSSLFPTVPRYLRPAHDPLLTQTS